MNRKQELKAKRDKAIFEDFRRMFNVELKRQDVIYTQLGERYFLDAETISRIVSKQSKLTGAERLALPLERSD